MLSNETIVITMEQKKLDELMFEYSENRYNMEVNDLHSHCSNSVRPIISRNTEEKGNVNVVSNLTFLSQNCQSDQSILCGSQIDNLEIQQVKLEVTCKL